MFEQEMGIGESAPGFMQDEVVPPQFVDEPPRWARSRKQLVGLAKQNPMAHIFVVGCCLYRSQRLALTSRALLLEYRSF